MSRSKRLQVATMLSLLAMSGLVACGDTEPEDGPTTGSPGNLTEKGGAPLDRVQFSYGDDYESFDGHQISWEQ